MSVSAPRESPQPAPLQQLEPIEYLARHRELTGYHTLDELAEVIQRLEKRTLQQVTLNGPDAMFISQYAPAADFLVQALGLQRSTDSLGGEVLIPPVPPAPGTSAFLIFQKQTEQALADLEWARWVNTSLLRLRVHSIRFLKTATPAPEDEFGISCRVVWMNVLGKKESEDFPVADRYYPAAELGAALEAMNTRCTSACDITVTVWRKRWVSDAAVGVATYAYDNTEAITALQVDLKAGSSSPAGLPIGSLTIEVDSIFHRYKQIEQLARDQAELARRNAPPAPPAGGKPDGATPGDRGGGANGADPTPGRPELDTEHLVPPPQLKQGDGADDYL